MAQPSELKLHIATTADDAAISRTASGLKSLQADAHAMAAQARDGAAAWMRQNDAVIYSAPALKSAAATHATLSQETDKAGRSTQTFGEKALAAAYFADDLQYGIKGILNNIPMLAMSLGLGAGVAGVVSILAVGFSVLSDKMGWFAETAKTTTGNLKQLSMETRNAAAAASEEARHTDEAEKSLEAHNKRIRESEEAYKELATALGLAAEKRTALANAIIKEAEAEAGLEIAKAEQTAALQNNYGETPQELERAKLEITMKKEKKVFDQQQELLRRQESDAQKLADAEEAAAKTERDNAAMISNKSEGLLTPQARKKTQAERNAAEAKLKEEKAKADETPEQLYRVTSGPFTGEIRKSAFQRGQESLETVPNPAYPQAQERAREVAARKLELDRKLEADRLAQEQSGLDNPAALRGEVEPLLNNAATREITAQKLRQDAENSRMQREASERAFKLRMEEMQVRTDTRIGVMDQQQEEAKAKSPMTMGIKSEGADVVQALKSSFAVPGEMLAALREEIAKADKGKGDDGLKALIQEMTAYVKNTGRMTDPLEKEIKELRSALAEQRNGR